MTWRSVVVSKAATLRFRDRRLIVEQPPAEASIPLEDIAVLVLESSEILLSSRLLQECAATGITVLTVGRDHHPNGALMPYLPHSRPLKMLNRQLESSLPQRKRAWQMIVRQKILNQARCLELSGKPEVERLRSLAGRVRSGDTGNVEAIAARRYFLALFGVGFQRSQDRLVNAGLNYGYAVLRAAIARSLTAFGFLPVLGLHHHNEQNAFNLADDLLEPFRPLVDLCVAQQFIQLDEGELLPAHKATLVNLLHHDVPVGGECLSALAAIESCVIGLGRYLDFPGSSDLMLPGLQALGLHRRE